MAELQLGRDVFRDQGYLCPIRVISEADAQELADKVTKIYKDYGAQANEYLGGNAHFLFPDLFDIVCNPSILDHVENILGPDILCWSSSFFSKPARNSSFVSWHQDLTYWGLDPADIITAWVAVTPSNRENGCMRVIPGSHAQGQVGHNDTFDSRNLLSRGQVLDKSVEENMAIDLLLKPGEMSLHDVLIVHGSEPNRSEMPRYGFAIRYIPTYCKQIGGRTTALLVRGQDSYNNFDPVPRPIADLHHDAVEFHKKANMAVKSILMAGIQM